MSYKIVPLDASGNYFEVQLKTAGFTRVKWWTAFDNGNSWYIVSPFMRELSSTGRQYKQIVKALNEYRLNKQEPAP